MSIDLKGTWIHTIRLNDPIGTGLVNYGKYNEYHFNVGYYKLAGLKISHSTLILDTYLLTVF